LSQTSSWAWDVRRRQFVYRSAEVYHLFGFDPQKGAMPLQAFRDRILPEDRRRNVEVASQAIREKADFEVDFRIALPDGSIKRIHSVGHPVLGSDGDVIELIGTHVDVTEQHAVKETLQKALDEIKKSEDRLRLVIDTIPALVWRTRPDGAAEFFNQPCLDYTGRSLDQALEWGWTSVVHPDDVASLLETCRATWMSGRRGEAEARLRRFDGEYRWFLLRNQPLHDEAENIVKWYGSGTDIEDPQAGRDCTSRERAALSRLRRNGLRLALGDGAGPPGNPHIGEHQCGWLLAFRSNWPGSMGNCH